MSVSVEAYFTHLRDIRGSDAGVAETSYYGPIAELLNAEGGRLKPIAPLRSPGTGEYQ